MQVYVFPFKLDKVSKLHRGFEFGELNLQQLSGKHSEFQSTLRICQLSTHKRLITDCPVIIDRKIATLQKILSFKSSFFPQLENKIELSCVKKCVAIVVLKVNKRNARPVLESECPISKFTLKVNAFFTYLKEGSR